MASVISGFEMSNTTSETGASSKVILNEVSEPVSLKLIIAGSRLKAFGESIKSELVLEIAGLQRNPPFATLTRYEVLFRLLSTGVIFIICELVLL